MGTFLLKLILYLKLDILREKISYAFSIAEIKRFEQNCGCKINYVKQGFNGVKIISSNGDISKFNIHQTSHLKSDTLIDCTGGVKIGKYFHTGRGLTIFSTNHNWKNSKKIPYDDQTIYKEVIIGDFVWIGANVTIVPGVEIKEGAIIGGGSVVTKNVEKGSVVGGNPAKEIAKRDLVLFEQHKLNKNFY